MSSEPDIIEESPTPGESPEPAYDLSTVPTAPGCYIMRDAGETVIYVGKAKNIRARLRSYFNDQDTRQTVKFLMGRMARIDFIVTASEKEALLLENSLIKEHRPRYNIRLRDDKTYVSLRLNVQHPFPRLVITRPCPKDGARYFGPYSDTQAARQTLKQLQKVFPLRLCSDTVLKSRSRPCLYHQMGRCTAPCVKFITPEAYRELVDQVTLALQGRSHEVEQQLRDQIADLAERLEYEKAAVLRDRLAALKATLEKQHTASSSSEDDRDVFGVHTEGRYAEFHALFFRSGKLNGSRSFSMGHCEAPLGEMLGSLMLQYYANAPLIPPEILAPLPVDEADTLAQILTEQQGRKVIIHCPQRGDKLALVTMANENARTRFAEKRLGEQAQADLIEQSQARFHLSRPPRRIECCDISTIQGDKAVGAIVAFMDGTPDKSRYRRYTIRMVEGQDDFGMMREVLLRRLKRGAADDSLPDLLLIDGGKGQLNVAVAAVEDCGLTERIDVMSIAKSRTLEDGDHSPERFFRPGIKNPFILPQNSPIVLFLARVRDETHRFAITFHREKRAKSTLRSALLDIPGVGEKRARALLRELGSLARIREATEEVIAKVPGFSLALARMVKEALGSGQPEKTAP